ncbi:MAG: glutamate--tRNA ligase [Anaerolineaceae bacterium 4572_78]|nr:MAG: glutamate--tRNA ligase [Anaerolineaceae bacterium 4572_78]
MNTQNKPVRVRYAPSPTGFFHVGGARTALYDYLLAKQTGGQFIIRIEDTDQKRFNPEAVDNLFSGLRYLGLDWDEGPDVGGDYAPYRQTDRLEYYQKYAKILMEKGHAYRCFCSSERLAEVNKKRQKAKLPSGYDRHCRDISADESLKRAEAGEPFTIRLKVPREGTIILPDALRGDITFKNRILQDAVLMKSNGIPTYHLAVVVDDYLMKITHVIRGEEWISSYPLHGHIYNFLGLDMPIFVHLPVILNPNGKGKISKREKTGKDGKIMPVFVHTFEKLGYLPEAMINFMALLGWSYDDKTEIISRDELIERFSLDRVNTSGATWNYKKLNHFNGVYIRSLTVEDLTDRIMPYLKKAGVSADRETMLRITPMIQERITVLSEAISMVDFFFIDELPDYDVNLLAPKKKTLADVPDILKSARDTLAKIEFSHDEIETNLRNAVKESGLKAGQLFQPIRVATCGKKVAPPLFGTLEVLGKECVLHRIDKAIKLLGDK